MTSAAYTPRFAPTSTKPGATRPDFSRASGERSLVRTEASLGTDGRLTLRPDERRWARVGGLPADWHCWGRRERRPQNVRFVSRAMSQKASAAMRSRSGRREHPRHPYNAAFVVTFAEVRATGPVRRPQSARPAPRVGRPHSRMRANRRGYAGCALARPWSRRAESRIDNVAARLNKAALEEKRRPWPN
jgi:hypothetical protein